MNRTPAEAAWMGGEGQAKGYPGLTYWTDELGARMDDYYYEMTRLYLRDDSAWKNSRPTFVCGPADTKEGTVRLAV